MGWQRFSYEQCDDLAKKWTFLGQRID